MNRKHLRTRFEYRGFPVPDKYASNDSQDLVEAFADGVDVVMAAGIPDLRGDAIASLELYRRDDGESGLRCGKCGHRYVWHSKPRGVIELSCRVDSAMVANHLRDCARG